MSDRPGFLRWRPDHPAPDHPAPGHPAEGHEGTSPASADSLAFVVARVADVSPCRVPRSSGTVWSYANRGRDAGSDQTTVCARLHSCTGVIPGPCVGAAVAVAERRADSPAQHLGSSACSAGERRSRPGRTKAYRRCEGPVEPATGAVFRRPAVVARPAKESPGRSQAACRGRCAPFKGSVDVAQRTPGADPAARAAGPGWTELRRHDADHRAGLRGGRRC